MLAALRETWNTFPICLPKTFAIPDGDVLLRADGVPIKSSDAIISDVLARVERGNSVVVEGERSGAPRRWVYAPAGCAALPASSQSVSKPAS